MKSFVRVTLENAYASIGKEIVVKTRGKHITLLVLGVSGNTLRVNHPDLKNSLDIRRLIYVIHE